MTETERDSRFWRTTMVVVGVGTLLTGVWMAFRGDVATSAMLWSFAALCVARLRSPAARRWMDDHQYVFLVALLALYVVGMVDAMP